MLKQSRRGFLGMVASVAGAAIVGEKLVRQVELPNGDAPFDSIRFHGVEVVADGFYGVVDCDGRVYKYAPGTDGQYRFVQCRGHLDAIDERMKRETARMQDLLDKEFFSSAPHHRR